MEQSKLHKQETVSSVRDALRKKDVVLWVEGDAICYESPAEVMTPSVVDYLREHKPEVIAYLVEHGMTSPPAKPPTSTHEGWTESVHPPQGWPDGVPLPDGNKRKVSPAASPKGHAVTAPLGDHSSGLRLLDALWNAGYSIELAPSASGGWFILPVGNPPLTDEQMDTLFALYDELHDKARDHLIQSLAGVNMSPEDWNRLVRENRISVKKPATPAEGTNWTAVDAELATWTLSLKPEDLPPTPWTFRPGEIVQDNAGFLAYLQGECRKAPRGPRVKLGTLQSDLRILREKVEEYKPHRGK